MLFIERELPHPLPHTIHKLENTAYNDFAIYNIKFALLPKGTIPDSTFNSLFYLAI